MMPGNRPTRSCATASPPLNVESSTLSLIVDGAEHLLGLWNFGRIDLLTAQAEDCVRRLAAGKPAILRSGALGRQGVPFHLFDPPESNGGPAHISRFFIDDPDVEGWFPSPGWGLDDPAKLFEWVAAHRAALLTPGAADERRKPPLVRLPVPADELISELDALAATGHALLEAAAGVERRT